MMRRRMKRNVKVRYFLPQNCLIEMCLITLCAKDFSSVTDEIGAFAFVCLLIWWDIDRILRLCLHEHCFICSVRFLKQVKRALRQMMVVNCWPEIKHVSLLMMIIVMIVMTMLMIVMMIIDRYLLTSNEPCELRRRIGRAWPASQGCLHPHLRSTIIMTTIMSVTIPSLSPAVSLWGDREQRECEVVGGRRQQQVWRWNQSLPQSPRFQPWWKVLV